MKKFKRSAKFLDDGQVEFLIDSKTVVVRPVKESDYDEWPDLERPKAKAKPKAKRRRKVKNDAQGHAKSSASGDGV